MGSRFNFAFTDVITNYVSGPLLASPEAIAITAISVPGVSIVAAIVSTVVGIGSRFCGFIFGCKLNFFYGLGNGQFLGSRDGTGETGQDNNRSD
jgi:hypothetical protein